MASSPSSPKTLLTGYEDIHSKISKYLPSGLYNVWLEASDKPYQKKLQLKQQRWKGEFIKEAQQRGHVTTKVEERDYSLDWQQVFKLFHTSWAGLTAPLEDNPEYVKLLTDLLEGSEHKEDTFRAMFVAQAIEQDHSKILKYILYNRIRPFDDIIDKFSWALYLMNWKVVEAIIEFRIDYHELKPEMFNRTRSWVKPPTLIVDPRILLKLYTDIDTYLFSRYKVVATKDFNSIETYLTMKSCTRTMRRLAKGQISQFRANKVTGELLKKVITCEPPLNPDSFNVYKLAMGMRLIRKGADITHDQGRTLALYITLFGVEILRAIDRDNFSMLMLYKTTARNVMKGVIRHLEDKPNSFKSIIDYFIANDSRQPKADSQAYKYLYSHAKAATQQHYIEQHLLIS